jgi:hypothetical protein
VQTSALAGLGIGDDWDASPGFSLGIDARAYGFAFPHDVAVSRDANGESVSFGSEGVGFGVGLSATFRPAI